MRILILVVIASLVSFIALVPACSSFHADPDPDKVCMGMGTIDDCQQCCATDHPDGKPAFLASFYHCACNGTGNGAAGNCAVVCASTQCATPSTAPQAGDACDTCLNSLLTYGECIASVGTTCQSIPDCTTMWDCVNRCSAGNDDAACKSADSLDACQSCCVSNHTSGGAVYSRAFFHCACTDNGATDGSSGLCATECADSACKGSQPISGDPCDNCLNRDTVLYACATAPALACTLDADCSAMLACYNACPTN